MSRGPACIGLARHKLSRWLHNAKYPSHVRHLASHTAGKPPDYAFAFEYVASIYQFHLLIVYCSIDGVLLRSSHALSNASKTLRSLQSRQVPFILLTNGGGKKESQRALQISEILDIPLDDSMIVQSHTPLRGLVDSLADKEILVLGGDGEKCRHVAQE